MRGAEIVEVARSWIGTPYVHQASLKGAGCDCLGLLRGVWREVLGAEPCAVPSYSQDWDEVGRREVLRQAACAHLVERPPGAGMMAGDVLLFRMRRGAVAKHLGIFAGNGRFIHAYSGRGVVDSALTPSWHQKRVGVFAFPGVDPE